MKLSNKSIMTLMNFPTLPYDNVTYSFLLEIWFWGPTHPTFLYDVTLLDLFFFEGFPYFLVEFVENHIIIAHPKLPNINQRNFGAS